jgi:hypothetical protein
VEFAKMAGGEKDRTALDIMAGAQQSTSGHTFIRDAWFGAPSKGTDKSDGEEVSKPAATYIEPSGFEDLFPPPNETQEKLVPLRQRLLER